MVINFQMDEVIKDIKFNNPWSRLDKFMLHFLH
jgi:hypothetical protein